MTKALKLVVAPTAALLAAGAVMVFIALGDARQGVPGSPAPARASSEVDPYEVYLANNPDPSLVLSREDAQTRAFLGCGAGFALGTIDRVLADAYRPVGICSGS